MQAAAHFMDTVFLNNTHPDASVVTCRPPITCGGHRWAAWTGYASSSSRLETLTTPFHSSSCHELSSADMWAAGQPIMPADVSTDNSTRPIFFGLRTEARYTPAHTYGANSLLGMYTDTDGSITELPLMCMACE